MAYWYRGDELVSVDDEQRLLAGGGQPLGQVADAGLVEVG
jgi:hypothetical protein